MKDNIFLFSTFYHNKSTLWSVDFSCICICRKIVFLLREIWFQFLVNEVWTIIWNFVDCPSGQINQILKQHEFFWGGFAAETRYCDVYAYY